MAKASKKINNILPVPTVEDSPSNSAETPHAQNVYSDCVDAFRQNDEDRLKKIVGTKIKDALTSHSLGNYRTLLLFDDINAISDYHADQIYAGASANLINPSDILLIINSKGGRIEPAYLISKTLKRLSVFKFAVAIPRRAKSAATLIALGADEIHMGMVSQLGPIDPQFGGIPALALRNALDVIAELACKFPDAAPMLTNYLAQQIPLRILGYYQRVTESAEQYAERLLGSKKLADNLTAKSVAKHLVHHYKDHSFVIDFDEATSLLGTTIIREATPEYRAADEIFRFLNFVTLIADIHDKQFAMVGDIENGVRLTPKPPEPGSTSPSKLTNE